MANEIETPEATLDRLVKEEAQAQIQTQRVWNIDGRADGQATRAADLLDAAGLNFQVEKRPVFLADGRAIPEKFATVRSDNGDALGIVGKRYTIVQNASASAFFDVAVAHAP